MNRPIWPHLSEWTLHAYLDDELSPDERRRAEAHLAACAQCADELADLRNLFVIIESVPDIPLARDLTPAVLAVLNSRHGPRLAHLAGLELAAALLLLVFAWPVLSLHLEWLVALALSTARLFPAEEQFWRLPGPWPPLAMAWSHIPWTQFIPFLWLLIPLTILWLASNVYLLRGLPSSPRAR